MRSLKGTLFKGVILGTALVLAAAGGILYFSVNAQLVRQMDESLADKLHSLALSVEEKQYGLEVDLAEMRVAELEEADVPEFFYIGTVDGRIIYRSDALHGIPIPSFSEPVSDLKRNWHELPNGTKLRSVLLAYIPDIDDENEPEWTAGNREIVVDTSAIPGDPVVIQVFIDASSYQRFLNLFMLMLVGTGLGSIGVLSVAVWWTIKRGTNPINELASRIEGISDDDLTMRLDDGRVLRELVPIVQKLNMVLDRLEGSFSRERGFTSDAAHELRTPLAGLKSTIEVALGKDRKSGEYQKTLERSLEIVKQLENLVKRLLALARLETEQKTIMGAQILLESFVRDTWTNCSKGNDEKQVEVSFHFSNGSMALIDGGLFAQVLEELFRNALYYVDHGGLIKVSLLAQEEGSLQLKISNTGSQIAAEETDRVFDRFWRGNYAMGDTGLRSGLGLPIVQKIIKTMSIQMEIESEMGGEFIVTLTIPEG